MLEMETGETETAFKNQSDLNQTLFTIISKGWAQCTKLGAGSDCNGCSGFDYGCEDYNPDTRWEKIKYNE